MVKIYTVEYRPDYESGYFFGAFSTKEKAIEVRDRVRECYSQASVYEVNLDEEPKERLSMGRPWIYSIYPDEVDT